MEVYFYLVRHLTDGPDLARRAAEVIDSDLCHPSGRVSFADALIWVETLRRSTCRLHL